MDDKWRATRTNTDEHGRWAGAETRPYKSLRLCVKFFGCAYAALCSVSLW